MVRSICAGDALLAPREGLRPSSNCTSNSSKTADEPISGANNGRCLEAQVRCGGLSGRFHFVTQLIGQNTHREVAHNRQVRRRLLATYPSFEFPGLNSGVKWGLFEHNLCVDDYLGFVFADDIDGPLGVAGGPLVPKVRAIPRSSSAYGRWSNRVAPRWRPHPSCRTCASR